MIIRGITDYIKTRQLYENSYDRRITFPFYNLRNS